MVRAGCVAGLQALAQRVGCGVVNTWGAKGVLRWDDPLHFGTAGLQARDFELAGLGELELLITTGLDPAEVTSSPWEGRAEVVDVAPADLAGLVLPPLETGRAPERPRLYTELAAVVGPLYDVAGSPPARAAALAAALPPGGLVVAAPGLVGFWIARTFPTAVPDSVFVPATAGAEQAWARARQAAQRGRAVTLVAVEPPPVDLPGVTLELWPPAEVDLDPSALVAVAGEIVAWGGLA